MPASLYIDLTDWYRLLDPPADHADECAHYLGLFRRAIDGRAETLLELGAGAGNNALFLKAAFACTLTDISEPMRALSKETNPECEHLEGDMRTLRLGRTFDAVLVHDAVCYMTTEADLRAAAATAFAHTRPGGAALFVPDLVRETFAESSQLEGSDEADGSRSLRCLMWTRDPDPADDTYAVDFAFLLRDGAGVRAAHDQHVEGLFSRARWIAILSEAGYRVELIAPYSSDVQDGEHFLCRRP